MLPHWKHLDSGQRKAIANMIAQGFRLKAIAAVVGVDPTAVSKEIKRNRTRTSTGPECPKTRRFPFVCGNCQNRYKRSECQCARYRYIAEAAQSAADARLVEARRGIDVTEEEFKAVDEAVKKGVEAGRSIYAISRDAPVADVASQSTLYSWIERGIMTVKRIDLPKAARYKKRAKRKYDYKGASKRGKEGRKYTDYLRFRMESPGLLGVQMDYLGSIVSDKFAIFVVVHPELHHVIGRKMKKGDQGEVAAFWNELEDALGAEAFAKAFPFILTDNDPCFSDAASIEASKETGEIRTRLFYCDPYVSNQKGSVENMNSQLRRYFPKKRSVDGIPDAFVSAAFDAINTAPVKSLGGITPKAAFKEVFGGEIAEAVERFMKD